MSLTAGAEHGIISTCGGRGYCALLPDETRKEPGPEPERGTAGRAGGTGQWARAGKEEGTEMLEQLNTPNKVVGAKQVRRALKDGRAARLFMAMDADPRLLQPLVQEAVRQQVPVTQAPSMKELGSACGIAVGAAVAVLLR